MVSGGNGDDTISLDNAAPPAGQALPPAQLFGGNGNDTLIGGDGNDTLNGGNGNDTVVGGKGTDMAFLGNGNDTFIWNPGDGNDTVDGGRGLTRSTSTANLTTRHSKRRRDLQHRCQRLRGRRSTVPTAPSVSPVSSASSSRLRAKTPNTSRSTI